MHLPLPVTWEGALARRPENAPNRRDPAPVSSAEGSRQDEAPLCPAGPRKETERSAMVPERRRKRRCGPTPRIAAMTKSLQELSDRLEIQDLMVAYSYAIDHRQWEDLDDVFTADAIIDYSQA